LDCCRPHAIYFSYLSRSDNNILAAYVYIVITFLIAAQIFQYLQLDVYYHFWSLNQIWYRVIDLA